MTVSGITKNSAVISWSGGKGDVLITKDVTLTCDYVAKVAGSVVENANLAKNVAHANLQNPDSELWREFAQSSYDAIAGLDNLVSKPITSDSGKIAQALFKYDVIETIKRYDPDYFVKRGAATLAEEVAVAKEKIGRTMKVSVWGYGSGAAETKMTVAFWSNTSSVWNGNSNNTTNAVKEQGFAGQNAGVYVSDKGLSHVIAYAPSSDGATPSVVSIDCANLEITLPVTEKIENQSSDFKLTDLDSNTTYTVKVVNAAGESEEITFTTAEITYKEVTLILDFADKRSGSFTENPNTMRSGNGASLLPNSSFISELGNSHYTRVSALDDEVSTISTSVNAQIQQRQLAWDVVKSVEKVYPNYFSENGAFAIDEKIGVLLSKVTYLSANAYGFGSGADGNSFVSNLWNGNTWTEVSKHEFSSISKVSATPGIPTLKNYIRTDGRVYNLLNTIKTDSITPSTLYLDYANLEITLLVEED